MTFQETVQTDFDMRPQRVAFLAQIPRELFTAISDDLAGVPDWHVYFIKNNPPGWPQGMYEVVSRHLEGQLLEAPD
jgi:hypothetical protein